ncbi:30S ribosomal protein S18 [Williamsoniiplasma somnilux]|uniref:Small ribosomal subunit protein bS18 n=1 Tax=Williamsoniiplasma somnilux TaxID=215578 RepID=A0A2K8P2G4_9MOLU|nr:30S ribosomal protein S18 [Williamsoniiplasma somnilux]ATZ19083.1 30S ribosomal protein S18 [Williamsoniiplasma somnilux]
MIKKFVRKRKKVNFFAKNNIKYIDYKDVEMLKKFISGNGQILPRRVTGTSPKDQRSLALAIKRSRQMGLLPFVVE